MCISFYISSSFSCVSAFVLELCGIAIVRWDGCTEEGAETATDPDEKMKGDTSKELYFSRKIMLLEKGKTYSMSHKIGVPTGQEKSGKSENRKKSAKKKGKMELISLWMPDSKFWLSMLWCGCQQKMRKNQEMYFYSILTFCKSSHSLVGMAHKNDKSYLFFAKWLLQYFFFFASVWPMWIPERVEISCFHAAHNIPNCMKDVTWLMLCLSTNGHRSACLVWLPFI